MLDYRVFIKEKDNQKKKFKNENYATLNCNCVTTIKLQISTFVYIISMCLSREEALSPKVILVLTNNIAITTNANRPDSIGTIYFVKHSKRFTLLQYNFKGLGLIVTG